MKDVIINKPNKKVAKIDEYTLKTNLSMFELICLLIFCKYFFGFFSKFSKGTIISIDLYFFEQQYLHQKV